MTDSIFKFPPKPKKTTARIVFRLDRKDKDPFDEKQFEIISHQSLVGYHEDLCIIVQEQRYLLTFVQPEILQ